MKINIISTCLILLLLAGCDKKEDNIFSQSPDERLSATLQEYQQTLESSPNGWLLSINTGASGGYRFWVSFNDKTKVSMMADLDYNIRTAGETSKIPQESTYRLKGLLSPSILFDTYNYLHILADPEKNVNGATENGTGLISDFEFSFIKQDNGRLYLKGNFNSCLAFMDPVSPAEMQSISNGGLKTVFTGITNYLEKCKFPSIKIGETKLLTKPNTRKTDFAYLDDTGNLIEKSIGSYMDMKSVTTDAYTSDVYFFEPVNLLGDTFIGLKWDAAKDCYTMTGQNKSYEVFDNGVPPYPLHLGVNQTFTKLYLDAAIMQGTIPQSFMDQVYNPASTSIQGNGRSIVYVQCVFNQNATSKEPQMELGIRYKNNSTSAQYTATWYYTYLTNEDGTITFTSRKQSGSSNERGQEPFLRKIPDFFCTLEYSKYDNSNWANSVISKTEPHTFRIDWAPNRTPGLTGNIGGLYRVDMDGLYIAGQLSAK